MKKFILMKTFSKLFDYFDKNNLNYSSNISLGQKFDNLNSINNANALDIIFFNEISYKDKLNKTKAIACFIKDDFKLFLPPTCFPIIVDDPYLAYAHTSNYLNRNEYNNIILDNKIFESNNIIIGKNTIIRDNTLINENSIIQDNVVLGPNVSIGKNSIIKSNCSISNTHIGDNCLIQSGTVIGDSGFGFTIKEKIKISHTGNVVIGNNVKIGSNCTIDRSSLESTIIGDDSRIDNLVHIAHNVNIGKGTIIAGQTGIAGSSKIGNNCVIGGQVGISGHLIIGNDVIIAAKSGVTKNIASNSIIAGFPAIDIKKWKKNIIKFNKGN